MNYLVTDLEATCFENNEYPREDMEIIEIGAVILNSNLEVVAEFSKFVKPTIHPQLTDFCKKLTHIKQEDVDLADTLDKVLPEFSYWALSFGEYQFTSWGAFDYNQFNRETHKKGFANPLIQNNMNYKVRFAKIKNLKRKNGVGVGTALNILNLTFEGLKHRAIYDAKNVVRIMQKTGV